MLDIRVYSVYNAECKQENTTNTEETKMKMKKILAIVFAALMTAACLASCGAKEKDKLIMCTNATFPPYEYYDDETGAIVSVDAEVAAAICEKLGYELEIVDMEFSSIIPAIVEKYIPPEKAEQFAKKQ